MARIAGVDWGIRMTAMPETVGQLPGTRVQEKPGVSNLTCAPPERTIGVFRAPEKPAGRPDCTSVKDAPVLRGRRDYPAATVRDGAGWSAVSQLAVRRQSLPGLRTPSARRGGFRPSSANSGRPFQAETAGCPRRAAPEHVPSDSAVTQSGCETGSGPPKRDAACRPAERLPRRRHQREGLARRVPTSSSRSTRERAWKMHR